MPERPRFYAFTGDLGPAAVPSTELVPEEEPFSPEEVAGIRSETGPVLILYALGLAGEELIHSPPTVRVASFSLRSAGGAKVAGARLVDAATLEGWRAGRFAGDLNDGVAFLIAPRLRPSTRYTVLVRWRSVEGQSASQRFSFRTRSGSTPEGSALF
jgi:hypothetical protein